MILLSVEFPFRTSISTILMALLKVESSIDRFSIKAEDSSVSSSMWRALYLKADSTVMFLNRLFLIIKSFLAFIYPRRVSTTVRFVKVLFSNLFAIKW